MHDRFSRPHHHPAPRPGRRGATGRTPAARAPHRTCAAGGPCRCRILHRLPHPAPPRPACACRAGPGHRQPRRRRRYERARPGSRSTSTSKSPAASPTAAATRSSAARRVEPTGSRPWPATSAFLPHPRHGLVRRPGHQPSLDPALAAADQRQGERSHRTCSRNGPTSGPTPQRPNGRQRFLTGWTGTTTTGPAPASTARPQPATSPTCPDNTPRAGCHRQATPALRTATTPLCHGVTLCFCSPGPCPDGPTGQPACLPGVASPPPHPAPGSLRFAT